MTRWVMLLLAICFVPTFVSCGPPTGGQSPQKSEKNEDKKGDKKEDKKGASKTIDKKEEKKVRSETELEEGDEEVMAAMPEDVGLTEVSVPDWTPSEPLDTKAIPKNVQAKFKEVDPVTLKLPDVARVDLASRPEGVRKVVEHIESIKALPTVTETSHAFEQLLASGYSLKSGTLERVAEIAVQNNRMVETILTTVDNIWPGEIIQGKTLGDGNPSHLPLAKGKRTPVSLAVLHGPKAETELGDKGKWVVEPDDLNAYRIQVLNPLTTATVVPANFTYNAAQVYSAEHAAYQLNASAKYFSYSGSLSIDKKSAQEQTVVFCLLRQEYFRVQVNAAPPCQDWFTDKITLEDVKLLTPDNPPVFVDSVSYGRLVSIIATTSSSFSEFNAAMKFAYNGGFGSASIEADTKHRDVLKNASYQVKVYGGKYHDPKEPSHPQNFDAFLTSLSNYLKPDPDPSRAMPIGFVGRYLTNNTNAAIVSAGPHGMTIRLPAQFTYSVSLDSLNLIDDCDGAFRGDGDWTATIKHKQDETLIAWGQDSFPERGGDIGRTSERHQSGSSQLKLKVRAWERDEGIDTDSDFGEKPLDVDLANILSSGDEKEVNGFKCRVKRFVVDGPYGNAVNVSVMVFAPPPIDEAEAKKEMQSRPPQTDSAST